MGAIASVTIADATPTNHVFVPSRIDQTGIAHWFTSASVMDARETITWSVRPPVRAGQVARAQVKLVIPVMDTVDTTLKVGEMIFNGEFVVPKRTTSTQRDHLWNLATNLLVKTMIQSGVKDVEGVY